MRLFCFYFSFVWINGILYKQTFNWRLLALETTLENICIPVNLELKKCNVKKLTDLPKVTKCWKQKVHEKSIHVLP